MGTTDRDHLLDTLTEGIEALTTSEAWRAHLDVQGRFHRYSFSNALLICAQDPDATRVAGFATWKKLGRSVLQGRAGHLDPRPDDGQADPDRRRTRSADRSSASVRCRSSTWPRPTGIPFPRCAGPCGVTIRPRASTDWWPGPGRWGTRWCSTELPGSHQRRLRLRPPTHPGRVPQRSGPAGQDPGPRAGPRPPPRGHRRPPAGRARGGVDGLRGLPHARARHRPSTPSATWPAGRVADRRRWPASRRPAAGSSGPPPIILDALATDGGRWPFRVVAA